MFEFHLFATEYSLDGEAVSSTAIISIGKTDSIDTM